MRSIEPVLYGGYMQALSFYIIQLHYSRCQGAANRGDAKIN